MLGLIADDLTGAGDASVQFAKRGWRTFVSWGLSPEQLRESAPEVLAVTTDSRALSNDVAEQRTADALNALMNLGIGLVFLKIDSTMRGSVAGQVAGALKAWRTRYPDARAVVCPAYPRMGRTVESNRLLVNGEPVERTAFGRDPVTPVHTSEMGRLLPQSPHIRVVDAATDADLERIAASIAADGPAVIPVGSGGLAEALAETWVESVRSVRLQPDLDSRQPDLSNLANRANSRILLQLSSLNPVSHTQVARLKAAFPDVVVLSSPEERGDSAEVAANLARAAAAYVKSGECDVLGMIGGDGARATLERLGASGIRVVGSLVEGIPLGIVSGGDADGMLVFTKAGGFGADDALVRAVEGIRS